MQPAATTLDRGLDLLDQGRAVDAVRYFEMELARAPWDPRTWFHKGRAEMALGRLKDAAAAFRSAIDADREFVAPYTHLARLHGGLDDADLERLAAICQDPADDHERRADACFAQAYEYERRGRVAEAWRAFVDGNAAKEAVYDRGWHEVRLEAVKETYPRDRLAEAASDAALDARPIFIVGLPRSGTTLLERLLSASREVQCLGESGTLDRFAEALAGRIPLLGANERAHLARIYLASAGCEPPLRPIDKNPLNFWNLGLVGLLFPRAVVLNCRRDILDVCISCFRQSFDSALAFACSLEALGHYAGLYADLMNHWRAVSPLQIVDVQYEDLVSDGGETLRSTVAVCGLTWTDEMQDVAGRAAPVFTASDIQVRCGLNTDAIGAARRYEAYLAPLRSALERYRQGAPGGGG